MTKTIRCDIVSAHEEIFSGEVSMVFASGIKDEAGEEQFYFVTGGIIEVQPHVVTVMADTAMRGEDIDQAAAEAAKAEAERELADRTGWKWQKPRRNCLRLLHNFAPWSI
jgi:F-type H+-transporting ATPase subunit epsilon